MNNINSLIPKSKSSVIKGLLAIEILIGHIGIVTGRLYLWVFSKFMICSVGGFFMLSGYGLFESLKKNDSFWEKYFINRFIKIFIPVIFSYIFFILLRLFTLKSKLSPININPFKFINWFIWELLIFYLLFYLFYFFKSRLALKILFIIISIFIIIIYYLGISGEWYLSAMCFPIGVYISKYNKRYNKSIVVKVVVLISSFGLSLFCFILPQKNIITECFLKAVAPISFVICIPLIAKLHIITNKATVFLGKISFEIYLYHIILLEPLDFIFKQFGFFQYLGIMIVLTFLISIIMNKLNVFVIKKIYRKGFLNS